MHVRPELARKDVLNDRLADAVTRTQVFLRDATGPVGSPYRADIILGQLAARIVGTAIRFLVLLMVAAKRRKATFLRCGVSLMPGSAL